MSRKKSQGVSVAEIGQRLRAFLRARKLRQSDVAPLLPGKPSANLVSLICDGLRPLRAEFLAGLRRQHDLNLNWLMTGEGEMFDKRRAAGHTPLQVADAETPYTRAEAEAILADVEAAASKLRKQIHRAKGGGQ